MADLLSHNRRSWNMGRIKGKNTKPELVVRSLLHRLGYRFRLHQKNLPGKPDIVLKKYGTVVFVNGCFWHRHKGCKLAYDTKSRNEFWQKKFKKNIERDRKNHSDLRKLGWKVMIIWECELNNIEKVKKKITTFLVDKS